MTVQYDEGSGVPDMNGRQEWRVGGKYHRPDGPAIISDLGAKYWYLNGNVHRTDGPAIEYSNNENVWYLNGKFVSRVIKNQNIIIGKSIEIEDDIATALRHVEGCFYEVLLGNKKVLVAKA